jgi:lipopolysaccharide export system protein LptA
VRALALAVVLLLGLAAAAQELALTGEGPVEILADDAIEWRRDEQVVIARGNARARRGTTTVFADRLIARYRDRQGAAPAAAGPAGAGEIWRLEAEGNVRIVGGNDRAEADRAVYDLDRKVLVLTGRALSLTNGADRVTARDALEYWAERRMAVARGEAVVTTENRRLEAETVVAYFVPEGAVPAAAGQTPAGRSVPGANRLDRAEVFGDVRITTADEVLRGERGVYTPGDGIARIFGNVRITRGQNQLNGEYGEVNLKTGVSRLMPGAGGRVAGMIVPEERRPPPPAELPPPPAPERRR